jgi:hypothetical protein
MSQALRGDPDRLWVGHRLKPLWDRVRSFIEENWPDAPGDDLDAVEACLVEFDSYDPKSFSFRYPMDKNGDPVLPQELTLIDLRALAEVMERLSGLLNGNMDGLGHFLEVKRELEGWYLPSGYGEDSGYS